MELTKKTSNRINRLFEQKKENILSIYFTAGHPNLEDTLSIIENLAKSGVDLIEIGIPFSDPVADGPTIQASCHEALENGMTLALLFEQIESVRAKVDIPLIMMGSINPIMQFGITHFCEKAQDTGIDGLIIPDLPMFEYQQEYKAIFDENNLHNVFLISPQTSEERIRLIDEETNGFIYLVSSSSITGARSEVSEKQEDYFKRIQQMQLKNPTLIGFGISNKSTFDKACAYAKGAIIGSAFVNCLAESKDQGMDISNFINAIRPTL